eukprot:377699_1
MTQTEIDANVRSIALHCGNNTPSMIGMNIEKGNKVYKLLAKLFTIHTWNQWCLRYALGNKPRAKTLFMHPMGHLYVLAERNHMHSGHLMNMKPRMYNAPNSYPIGTDLNE